MKLNLAGSLLVGTFVATGKSFPLRMERTAMPATAGGVAPSQSAHGMQYLGLCGQKVGYSLISPRPGTPSNVSAFSGIWSDDWKGGSSGLSPLCGALIVESVTAEGSTNVVYVSGKDEYFRTPWNGRFRVSVSGNTLSFKTARVGLTFRLSGATLNGTYDYHGWLRSGRFSKQ